MARVVTFFPDQVKYWDWTGWYPEVITEEEFEELETCSLEEVKEIIKEHMICILDKNQYNISTNQ